MKTNKKVTSATAKTMKAQKVAAVEKKQESQSAIETTVFKNLFIAETEDGKRAVQITLSQHPKEDIWKAIKMWDNLKGFESLTKVFGTVTSARVKLMFFNGKQQREVLNFQLDPKLAKADRIKEVQSNDRKFKSFEQFFFEQFPDIAPKKKVEAVEKIEKAAEVTREIKKRARKATSKNAPAEEVIDLDKAKMPTRKTKRGSAILDALRKNEAPAAGAATAPVADKKSSKPARKATSKQVKEAKQTKTNKAKAEVAAEQPKEAKTLRNARGRFVKKSDKGIKNIIENL